MQVHDARIMYKRKTTIMTPSQLMGGSVAAAYRNDVVTGKSHDTAMWGTGGYTSLGDVLEGWFVVPSDWNPEWPLGIRLHWTADESGSIDWKVLLAFNAQNTAIPAAATGALDTVIATASPSTVDFAPVRTARGIRDGHWSSIAAVHAGLYCSISVELDADATIDISSDLVWLLGVEFDYMPMLTRQPHNNTDAPLTDDLN